MNRPRGRSGFWPALTGLLAGAGLLYGYTHWFGQDRVYIDWGHAEDYTEFLIEQGEIDPPEPFKAAPLEVRAAAEIRAVPDVAVITAAMTAKDKLESRAVDNIAQRVNAVQTAIAGFDVQVSVTKSGTNRKYDPLCLSENNEARRRHNQINNDYWFNRRLDERGDKKTKRREPRPRIVQKICRAQSIEAYTELVIRVAPPDAAGDILQALADAGADKTRLYGYDFSNYDALYQDAASQAVAKARAKAEMIARHAKAELGEITEFYVGRPARTGRFGPQPTIINKSSSRPAPRKGYGYGAAPPPPPPQIQADGAAYYDEVIVTASRKSEPQNGRSEYKQDDIDAEGQEAQIPVTSNNALQMSLNSGPQTIRVSALLAYDYKTVIDGSLLPETEDK